MAYITKKALKDGTTSYRIQATTKDPRTNEYVKGYRTWRKPPDMTEYQAKRELDKIAYEFEQEHIKKVNGLLANDERISFADYVNTWLSRAQKNNSPNYYLRARALIKPMIEFFGKMKLKDISPLHIQTFIDKLQEHKVVREYAVMKKDIRTYLRAKAIKPKDLMKLTNVGDYTYQASERGENVRVDSARNLCKGLGIDFNEYYDVVTSSHPYTKESVMKFKRMLSTILATAKKQRLIDVNYATSEYILPIQGQSNEREIFDFDEFKKFTDELEREENPRWKIAMYIFAFMGLRRAEVAGLKWSDIDLERKTMSIARSVGTVPRDVGKLYKNNNQGYEFYDETHFFKSPKTKTSARTITMPDALIEKLKEYKQWYDNRKKLMGNLWDKYDMVIISDEGKPTEPGLFRVWFTKISARAGLKHITLHGLRHTHVSLLIASGVDMKTVSVRVGHAKTSTTSDIYSHFIKANDSKASQTIDNIFKKDKKE